MLRIFSDSWVRASLILVLIFLFLFMIPSPVFPILLPHCYCNYQSKIKTWPSQNSLICLHYIYNNTLSLLCGIQCPSWFDPGLLIQHQLSRTDTLVQWSSNAFLYISCCVLPGAFLWVCSTSFPFLSVEFPLSINQSFILIYSLFLQLYFAHFFLWFCISFLNACWKRPIFQNFLN